MGCFRRNLDPCGNHATFVCLATSFRLWGERVNEKGSERKAPKQGGHDPLFSEMSNAMCVWEMRLFLSIIIISPFFPLRIGPSHPRGKSGRPPCSFSLLDRPAGRPGGTEFRRSRARSGELGPVPGMGHEGSRAVQRAV